ncbi:Ulp1 protease family protein [Colletotrichum cuscutae]|uniref:Ulp1 protease family protein n=1 Tax=Colletotrichum cuscutae TaxID=1209917 RepID=A0AAI9Y4Y3_9PEZI|nr:Ulp1 protease family protein [Colletotrichum cuscutae]
MLSTSSSSLAPSKLTNMASDRQQIPSRRGFLPNPRKVADFFDPLRHRRENPPEIEKPRTYRPSPIQTALVNSLANPGLNHHGPLFGTNATQQLTAYPQATNNPHTFHTQVPFAHSPIAQTEHQKAQKAQHLTDATLKKAGESSGSVNTVHSPHRDREPLRGILKKGPALFTRSSGPTSSSLFTPAAAKVKRLRFRAQARSAGLGPSKNRKYNRFPAEDPFIRQPPIKATPFPKSQQSAYLRPATTLWRPAPKAFDFSATLRHQPTLHKPSPASHVAAYRARRRRLKDLVIQREGRIDLFGPKGPILKPAQRIQGFHTTIGSISTRKCSQPSSSFHLCNSNSEAESESEDTESSLEPASESSSPSVVPPGAWFFSPGQRTTIITPNESTLIEVNDGSATRRIFVRGSCQKTITVQSIEQESRALNQGSPNTTPTRKRPAEDSEFDLILANATDGKEPLQEPLANARGAAVLDSNEEDRPRAYTTWLTNIMTSVRGTVTKVSNSIVGYVYPRNNHLIAVERLSRGQQNGNTGTKRIRLEVVDDFADESFTPNAEPSKINLVWVDESTRIAYWHHIAPLVRTLRSICHRIEKRRSQSREGSPITRLDDQTQEQQIYVLGPYLDTFRQTAWIVESVYSHTFLAGLKTNFKVPQSVMDYTFSPEENFAITVAQRLFEHFPEECNPVLVEAGVSRRIIKGLSADLAALASRKPMPGLVQRAGIVGKVMKFFRGRESFGIEVSEDPISRIDIAMPGSFPDFQTNNEVLVEAEPSIKAPDERQILPAQEIIKPGSYYPPARTTEAYTFVKDQLADIASQRRATYKNAPPGIISDDLACNPSPISVLKRDNHSPASLKRLQKSRGLKRVHFSPSAKQSTPSPAKSRGFLSRIFGSPTVSGSPLGRHVVDASHLSDSQVDGSSDDPYTAMPNRYSDATPKSDDVSEESDSEKIAARCHPQLLEHLNKSLNGLEAKGFFAKDEPQDLPSSPSSLLTPPTLAGLTISDDKEEELEDLSLALQLLLDVDEARRREEEEKKARQAREERLLKTGGLRAPQRPLVTSLPAEWVEKVQATMQANPSLTLATTAESVPLKKHDFAMVVPPTVWLNDEIVNGALQWLDRYVNVAAGAVDVKAPNRVCVAMGSFFYKRLEENGVQNTERALRRYGINKNNFLNLETILMPICKNNHWTLLVIRPKKRTVSHMDSFNPAGSSTHTTRALNWVQAFLGGDYKASEWKVVIHEAPIQTNGYDCGVFTITNGMCLALGLNAIDAYSGEDLPEQRLRIAGMLLNKGFSGEFDLADL